MEYTKQQSKGMYLVIRVAPKSEEGTEWPAECQTAWRAVNIQKGHQWPRGHKKVPPRDPKCAEQHGDRFG